MLQVTPTGDGVRFEVHVKPRAKRCEIRGVRGGALDVALAAPPVDGAANAELVRFLAETLGVRQRDVTVVRGETSRTKLVEVRGVTPRALAPWTAPPPGRPGGS